MICLKCTKEIPENYNVCPHCGNIITQNNHNVSPVYNEKPKDNVPPPVYNEKPKDNVPPPVYNEKSYGNYNPPDYDRQALGNYPPAQDAQFSGNYNSPVQNGNNRGNYTPPAYNSQNNMYSPPLNNAPENSFNNNFQAPANSQKRLIPVIAAAFAAILILGILTVVISKNNSAQKTAELFAENLFNEQWHDAYGQLDKYDSRFVTEESFVRACENNTKKMFFVDFSEHTSYTLEKIEENSYDTTTEYKMIFDDDEDCFTIFRIEKSGVKFLFFSEYRANLPVFVDTTIYTPAKTTAKLNGVELDENDFNRSLSTDEKTCYQLYDVLPGTYTVEITDENGKKTEQEHEIDYPENVEFPEDEAENNETPEEETEEQTEKQTEPKTTTIPTTKPDINKTKYTTKDAEKFYLELMDEYNCDDGYNNLKEVENNLPEADPAYFIDYSEIFNLAITDDTNYNSTISYGGSLEISTISDIMSEEELNEYKANIKEYENYFAVYPISLLQQKFDSIWKPGRFDATKLDDDSEFPYEYVTSKNYLFVAENGRGGGYYKQLTKVKACQKSGNNFIIDAYLVETSPFLGNEQCLIDMSTGKCLGNLNTTQEFESVDAVLSFAGKDFDELNTIKVVIEITDQGLRLKSISEPYKTEPDIYSQEQLEYLVKANGGLNMRSSPSQNAPVIYLIPDGSTVTYYGASSTEVDWKYVSYEYGHYDIYGWVHTAYLR